MGAQRTNKFTCVKCLLPSSDFAFYQKNNKRDFICDILHKQKSGHMFSNPPSFRAKGLIKQNSGLKQKAWFMGLYSFGAFFSLIFYLSRDLLST